MTSKQGQDVSEVKATLVSQTFKREIRVFKNWGQWLEVAASPLTLDQKLGLLHGAFSVELGRRPYDSDKSDIAPYSHSERLEFFFQVADGWADDNAHHTKGVLSSEEATFYVGLDRETDRRGHLTEGKARQRIARKAFDMLVSHLFSPPFAREPGETRRKELEEAWLEEVISGPTFEHIQHFFRAEKCWNGIRIRNTWPYLDPRPNSEKVATAFLLKLGEFLWTWRGSRESRRLGEEFDTPLQRRVNGAKPWMIEVLEALGELRLLGPRVPDLNGPCLEKLKEIAFRNEFDEHTDPLYAKRKVESLDEACFLGSAAGWLLKRHELWHREHMRLTEIREATRAAEEATEKVARLTKSK